MIKVLTYLWILEFLIVSLAFGQEEGSEDEVENIFDSIVATSGRDVDVDAIQSKIDLRDLGNLESIFNSVIDEEEVVAHMMKTEAWRKLAEGRASDAAIVASKILAEAPGDDEISRIIKQMENVDYSRNDSEWVLDQYGVVLKSLGGVKFKRLIIYLMGSDPFKGLEILIDVYVENLSSDQKKEILDEAKLILEDIRAPREGFRSEDSRNHLIKKINILMEEDRWFVDLFISSCLRMGSIVNISPELRDVLERDPNSLANKMLEDNPLFGIVEDPAVIAGLENLISSRSIQSNIGLRHGGVQSQDGGKQSTDSDHAGSPIDDVNGRAEAKWLLLILSALGVVILIGYQYSGKFKNNTTK